MQQEILNTVRTITFAALLGIIAPQVIFMPEANAAPYRDRTTYYNDGYAERRAYYDNRRYYRDRSYYRGRPVYAERYRERVYAPPPVVYYPPAPSGLSLIFPLRFN